MHFKWKYLPPNQEETSEAKALGASADIFPVLKYSFLIVFALELILTVVYQVCLYFWKDEIFGFYIGKNYKLEEEEDETNR